MEAIVKAVSKLMLYNLYFCIHYTYIHLDFSGDDEFLDPNYSPALVRKFYNKFAQGISPSGSDSSTSKNVIAGASDNIVPNSSSHIPPELNERDLPTDVCKFKYFGLLTLF